MAKEGGDLGNFVPQENSGGEEAGSGVPIDVNRSMQDMQAAGKNDTQSQGEGKKKGMYKKRIRPDEGKEEVGFTKLVGTKRN